MVDEKLGKHALKWIQSAADNDMYYSVTEAALYMATAGFLDEANELLECLWKAKWPHSENVWLPDQSFEVLWFANGKRPTAVPFPQKSIDTIELGHRKYMTLDRWQLHMPMPKEAVEHLLGKELFRKSCSLARPADESDSLPEAANELEALAGLEKYVRSFDEQAQDSDWCGFVDSTCLGAELAAKNGQTEKATFFLRIWAGKYVEWEGRCYNFPALASNRHVAPLLLQGVLADPLGLNKTNCQAYLRDLKAAVEARMKQGRKLAYGKWTWERLLKAASTRAIKQDPESFTKEERKAKWLGRTPASGEAIAAIEQKLKVALPADYKEFLLTSNGFSALSPTAPALLPVEEIDFLRGVMDAEMLQILKDYPGEDMASAMESAILVSDKEAMTDLVLLIPPSKAHDSWQTWFFADWVPGEIRYPSFRHYFEQAYQQLQTDI